MLEYVFGLNGFVRNWFLCHIYLRGINIYQAISDAIGLIFGVQQWSVVLYTHTLAWKLRHHGIWIHMYANDTQLYTALERTYEISRMESLAKLKTCVYERRTFWNSKQQNEWAHSRITTIFQLSHIESCVCWRCTNITKPVCQERRTYVWLNTEYRSRI